MNYLLSSIPIEQFNNKVLNEIVGIFAKVAEIERPPKTKTGYGMKNIRVRLQNWWDCEFRLGSTLNSNSKLWIHPMAKNNTRYLCFDFESNTADDSQPRAVEMREKFHREIQNYIATL